MRRGPVPEPDEIKKAKGNPGRRRLSEGSVHIDDLSEEFPDFDTTQVAPGECVSFEPESATGKLIWDLIYPQLKTLRFVKATDELSLARYCEQYARWLKLKVLVDEEGETYETDTKHGKMQRINPKFQIMMDLENRLEKYEDRFGLNPAARQRHLMAMKAGSGEMGMSERPGMDEQKSSPIGILVGPSKGLN